MNTVYATPVNGTITLGTSFFNSLSPNTTVIIPNGTYDAAKIVLPANAVGITLRPESEGGVTFTGKTTMNIAGDNTTVSGFTFDHTRQDTMTITGDNTSITGNHFIGAGNPLNTQDSVIWIDPKAQNTHFTHNEVEASISMTIKVRADVYGSKEQPTGTVIQDNYFHDIARLSDNGQEVIQIAGPGGQWIAGHDLELGTLIKNNIFYKTHGDVETISMKVGGTTVTGNVFMHMEASPTVRNGGHNTIEGNILIDTRPIRVMGDSTEITNNVIIDPKKGAFILSNGTDRYEVAESNTISNNIVYSRNDITVLQTLNQSAGPVTQIHDNVVADNGYVLTATSKATNFVATGVDVNGYTAHNTIAAGEVLNETALAWLNKLLSLSDNPQALLNNYLKGDGLDVHAILHPHVIPSYFHESESNFTAPSAANAMTGTESAELITGAALNDVVHAGDGADNVKGNTGNDVIFGEAGNDTLFGGDGNDALAGGTGDDAINAHLGNDTVLGGDGNDILRGNEGDDIVVGGAGNDTVMGQEGNDTLVGGTGCDLFVGGTGLDIFAFEQASLSKINDFSVTDGDLIDLSFLLPDFRSKTDDVHDYVQITFAKNAAFISVDADGGADHFVQVAELRMPTALSVETLLHHIIVE